MEHSDLPVVNVLPVVENDFHKRGGLREGLKTKVSATGTRTLVSCVKGKYANHLHHSGVEACVKFSLIQSHSTPLFTKTPDTLIDKTQKSAADAGTCEHSNKLGET